MCGICGIHGFQGDPNDRDGRVAAMEQALVHRGPDDRGAYADAEVSLGFRRLSVIDLETGGQPIRLEDDRAVIVLNGEIYNFRELRAELEPRHSFRTRGDVEVVLRLYAEGGVDALRRLNGMFALAIWDRSRRTLVLARDRCGIKPLFLWRGPEGATAFSSELRSLLAGGLPGRPPLDRLELGHYLAQKYTSPGGSILQGVHSLPPGSVLEIGPNGSRTHQLWESPSVDPAAARGDAAAILEERLESAVRRQLVADVPVGVFLSGGLDSGTLTSLVRRVEAGPVRTFSVGFEGPGAVNELPAARRVAAELGTEHHEMTLHASQVASDLEVILDDLDGPLGDATCIPTWYMSRHARGDVTVALSGEGADELFGGYRRQRFDALLDRIGPLGRALLPGALALSGRPASARLRRRLNLPPGLARQLDWSRVLTQESVESLTAEPLPSEQEILAMHQDLARDFSAQAAADPLNARLEVDRRLFLPGDLLPKVDRMSMAHSLEVRVPYLDNEVLDLVTAMPGSFKSGWRHGKRLLRSVAAGLLPAGTGRRKQGFDVPIGLWLRGALREPLTDLLAEDAVRRRGLFRPAAVTSLVQEHLEGDADHGEALWLLLVLEGWMRKVLDPPCRYSGQAGNAVAGI